MVGITFRAIFFFLIVIDKNIDSQSESILL